LRFQALRLGVMKKAVVVGVANGAQAHVGQQCGQVNT
jgi:hypothetical protein